jgi:lipopolysaccharide/colanic/teichoic acid biosynthesis glycosyltransferase
MMLKRLFDLFVTFAGLMLLLPLLLVLALLVRLKHGAPVFFRQTRPGLHGRPFKMVKFRTMTDERGADGNLLPDEQRLSWFGKFMRSTSLDELPELWNVLKGDMSLVGPRPLLMEYRGLSLACPQRMRVL